MWDFHYLGLPGTPWHPFRTRVLHYYHLQKSHSLYYIHPQVLLYILIPQSSRDPMIAVGIVFDSTSHLVIEERTLCILDHKFIIGNVDHSHALICVYKLERVNSVM